MNTIKQLKLEKKQAGVQQQVLLDLNATVKDIERCERTIASLQQELGEVNARHQGPRNTRQDVDYLSALLACAKKKLAWEKQIASVQKRAPAILQQMAALMNDPVNPPSEQTRMELLTALQRVQAALERLQSVKVE